MQTYSHWLITKVLQVRLTEPTVGKSGMVTSRTAVHSMALLLGSVMPDVPLVLLTIGYMINRRWLNPVPLNEGVFGAAYDTLYLTNPWWIMMHNLMHAPPLILLYALVGLWVLRRGHRWGFALCWFAGGCGLHALIDIFTHVTDGPLLFFPFNWTYRFAAPVSYWDPHYGANIFAPLEHLLDLGILIWLVRRWWRRKT